ncbi:hypothetical protein DL764_000487 [Monosporascus ibericus]|uniref:Uncharacterized protein n=1 Tax=Monosporascus ibericus TaxID=155417 RepID=A0A4Q4TWP2_9PEZI|nr:hypothetical protein DL764_000487 [Monosporascus ibericus]
MDQESSQKCIGLVPAVVDSARGTFAQVASAFAGDDHFLIIVVFAVLLYVGVVMEMLREVTHARTASGNGDGEEYDEMEGMHKMDEIALLKAALGRRRRSDCIQDYLKKQGDTDDDLRSLCAIMGLVATSSLKRQRWSSDPRHMNQYNVDGIVGDTVARKKTRKKARSSPAFSERDHVLAMSGISMQVDGPEDDDAMSVDEEPFLQELVERETRKALEQKGIWDPMSIDQGNCKVVGVSRIHRDVPEHYRPASS